MPGSSRRAFLQTAAVAGVMGAAGTTVGSPVLAAAEQPQPPFGPPPTPLASADLPSFRFALGQQQPMKFEGGTVKEAKVAEFPVSEKLAGAVLELEPGGLRELHWHYNYSEWAFIIDGQCRVTVTTPSDQSQTLDFGPGDVWYFPTGYGHSVQGIGDKPCRFVLVFDNGYFGEFGIFSITGWVALTSPAVLAKNFGVPESTFADFPKKAVFITKGPVPPPLPEDPAPGSLSSPPLMFRYHLLGQSPEEFPGGTIRIVSKQQFPISTTMTGAIEHIKPGAMRSLHWHPNAAEWQYYIKGNGQMTVFGSTGRARTEEFSAGDVGYAPQGYGHYIENTGGDDLEVLLVWNNGTFEEISLANWMAHHTPELLATNFKVPASTFDGFPKKPTLIPK